MGSGLQPCGCVPEVRRTREADACRMSPEDQQIEPDIVAEKYLAFGEMHVLDFVHLDPPEASGPFSQLFRVAFEHGTDAANQVR